MDIRLIDHTGTYHYQVTTTEIVTPEQVSVLDILSEPGLALVHLLPLQLSGSRSETIHCPRDTGLRRAGRIAEMFHVEHFCCQT